MNWKFLLPPLAALLVCALWFVGERARGVHFETRGERLSREIPARGEIAVADRMAELRSRLRALEGRAFRSPGTDRASLEIDEFFHSLSPSELEAALDEISATVQDEVEWYILHAEVAHLWIRRDPLSFLERWGDELALGGDRRSAELALLALDVLAGRDPGAAIAWLDASLAAGGFSERNLRGELTARVRAERALAPRLMVSEPERFAQRLERLDPESVSEILKSQTGWAFPDGAEAVFARELLKHLPEDDAMHWLSAQGALVASRRGREEAARWIGATGLPDGERAMLADRVVARGLRDGRADLGETLEWAGSLTPGRDADEVALAVLLQLQRDHAAVAARHARTYLENGAGEEWLARFLADASRLGTSEREELVDLLTDPTLRGRADEDHGER